MLKPKKYISFLNTNLFLTNFICGYIPSFLLNNTEIFKHNFLWSNTFIATLLIIYHISFGIGYFFSIFPTTLSTKSSLYFSIILSFLSTLLTIPLYFIKEQIYYFIFIVLTSFTNGLTLSTISNYAIQKLRQRNREFLFYISTSCGFFSAFFINNIIYFICGYKHPYKYNTGVIIIYIYTLT